MLNINPPVSWVNCKVRLKHHYRPRTDQMGLTRIINILRVTSIRDLDFKVRTIVEEITDFSVSENNNRLVDILSGLLIERVKELACGPMAISLMNKTTLTDIRTELAKYIGLNYGNLYKKLFTKHDNDNYTYSKQTQAKIQTIKVLDGIKTKITIKIKIDNSECNTESKLSATTKLSAAIKLSATTISLATTADAMSVDNLNEEELSNENKQEFFNN